MDNPIRARVHIRPLRVLNMLGRRALLDDSDVRYTCRIDGCAWTHWGFYPIDISCCHDFARTHLVNDHQYLPCLVCKKLIPPDPDQRRVFVTPDGYIHNACLNTVIAA